MEVQLGSGINTELTSLTTVVTRTGITTNCTSLNRLDILTAELLCVGRVASKLLIKVVIEIAA